MPKMIISVENLSKCYSVGHRRSERYASLREVVVHEARSFVRKTSNLIRGNEIVQGDEIENFWALKDLSFDIKQGEVVGVIGRNGAGKSTLLKILSRITEPSEGRVVLHGDVASLLEIGTGFHPELSGRENIFLSGAIMGMTRSEIVRKFDEIVAFAGIEKFLDTPVKRYSSGMYVRLAFAVAAHLEPDILLVDEVLAVGDAEFQKKCLTKMGEVAQAGRTVLFVSHSMPAINRLCQRCILLEGGRIKLDGEAQVVSAQYMVSDTGTTASRDWIDAARRPGDEVARLISVCVKQNGMIRESVDIRYPVDVEMTYEVLKDGANLLSAFAFFDQQGTLLFVNGDLNDAAWSRARPRGAYTSQCRVPGNLFAEGMVRVLAEVATRHPVYELHFWVPDSAAFQVVDSGEPGSVRSGWGRDIPGVMRPMCAWQTKPVNRQQTL